MSSSEGANIVTCTVKLPSRKCYIVHWQSKEPITAWCEIHTKGPTGKITSSLAKCEMDASNPLTQVRSSREGLTAGRNLGFYGRKPTSVHLGMAWLEIRRATAIRVSEVTRDERRLTIDWVPSDRPDVGAPHATFVFNFELTAPPPVRSLSRESEDLEDEEEDELLSDHHSENGTPTDASHISESPVISDSAPPSAQKAKINSTSKRQSVNAHSASSLPPPARMDDNSQVGSPSVSKRLKRDSAPVSTGSKQPSPKRPRVDKSAARIDKSSPRAGKPSTRGDKLAARTDKPVSRIESPASRNETPMPHVRMTAIPSETPTTRVDTPSTPIRIPAPPLSVITSYLGTTPVDVPTSHTDTPPINMATQAAPHQPEPASDPAATTDGELTFSQRLAAEEEQQSSEPPSPSELIGLKRFDVSDNDDEDQSYSAKIAKLDLEINSYIEKYELLKAKDTYMQVKREWVQLLADVRAAEFACGVKHPKETLVSDSDHEESYTVKRKKLELSIPVLKNRLVILKERKKYLDKKAKLKQLMHDIEAAEKRCDDASTTISRIIASNSPAAERRLF